MIKLNNSREAATILESQDRNFDTRKFTNRAGHVTIPASLFTDIASEGVTIEALEKMRVPLFKYRTQITLHGQHQVPATRAGGYANIILNQNGSLGIRYTAIDYGKKARLARLLKAAGTQIGYHRDSTGDYFYATEERARPLFERTDASLFVGTKGLGYYVTLWGQKVPICCLNIAALYEANFWALAENLTGKTRPQLEADEQALKAQEQAKEQEWQDKLTQIRAENAQRDQRDREARQKVREQLQAKGVERTDKVQEGRFALFGTGPSLNIYQVKKGPFNKFYFKREPIGRFDKATARTQADTQKWFDQRPYNMEGVTLD